jgi:hypothetical protein
LEDKYSFKQRNYLLIICPYDSCFRLTESGMLGKTKLLQARAVLAELIAKLSAHGFSRGKDFVQAREARTAPCAVL